jgi:bacterioferritin (cytochrome b1)
MTATKTRRPKTDAEQRSVNREASNMVIEDRRQYADRVLHRLEGAPRFQSVGRKKYVYVEDITEALERELMTDTGGAE